jgi:hypothetical protein
LEMTNTDGQMKIPFLILKVDVMQGDQWTRDFLEQ